MRRKLLISIALALVVMPTSARPTNAAMNTSHEAHPVFIRADSGAGRWTGYTANLQIRPLEYALWSGGYLEDGTFVQNGFIVFDGRRYAFAWAPPKLDIQYTELPDYIPMYSWITFQLTQTNNTWKFAYKDNNGWHEQGSFQNNSKLRTFQLVDEYWVHNPEAPCSNSCYTTPIQPKVQAIQHARVRTGTKFRVTPMYYSANEDCGYNHMTSTTPSNLVIRSGPGPCYKRLW